MCYEAFDHWKRDPDVDWSNVDYGATAIAGTDILFPSGSIDPWHALGFNDATTPPPQPTETPVYILGTAHCADLYAPANSDPQSLTDARNIIKQTVSKWLA